MKWAVVGIYLLAMCHIHFRGKVRLPILRQLFDHSSFMAPINMFMHFFSKVPSTPYLSIDNFKELAPLEQHWEVIRAEAEHLITLQKIKASEQNNDAGFNSFFKTGWKRFYLKWYDASHPSAERFCPQTVALLRGIPSVKAAMFAELPVGAKLNPHRDPFAGSLRYHLGLATPNDDRCFIDVDGERYSWRDGRAVMFDESYIHWAVNGSDGNRIILFCDIERPMRFRWAQAINRWLGRTIMTAASSPNETGDQTGGVSKLFYVSWIMGQYRRRLKAWNKTVYKLVKFGLIIGIAALIIFI
ncbi:lipid A hydroxylase LpxO [Janthinobacterium agaricidamnosum]|uniref:Aspartyl/Asparaginyl beta-hydroxylase family protein n=1 Tax=Janthinobacterium agaricidamnosum NBRC 102515 = DSM 9628 TaxID=1349767 RepID=W0VAR9_9BURK|nr:lipid A hydroxylase LpxO [Janthinobacterium agaricidamnosum]CDG84715.1 aspartyl/Asparaginyl beta-hydroxylase family protein [Janthinobacterium agaricidamnosum NBRC 102515 = DSM 9628]